MTLVQENQEIAQVSIKDLMNAVDLLSEDENDADYIQTADAGFDTVEVEESDSEISADELNDIIKESVSLQKRNLRNGKSVQVYRETTIMRDFSEDEDEEYVDQPVEEEEIFSDDDAVQDEDLADEVRDLVLDAVTTPAPNLLKGSKVLRDGKQLGQDAPVDEMVIQVQKVQEMLQDE